MKLEAIGIFSVSKGLMDDIGGGGYPFPATGKVEGILVPLKDGKILWKIKEKGILFPLFG